MSDDLKQLYPIFFDEISELLTEIETRLIDLSEGGAAAPERADWDAILRAVHSIKGGAATFGCEDMAQLTHRMESCIAKLRLDAGSSPSVTIETLLQARDVLTQQLDAHQAANRSRIAAEALSMQLDDLAGETDKLLGEVVISNDDQASLSRVLRIEFPGSGLNAQEVADLLIDLAERGSLEALTSDENGTQSHVLRLSTRASEADIWAALAFSVDPHQLKIVVEPSERARSEHFHLAAAVSAIPVGESDAVEAEKPAAERRSFERRSTDRPEALIVRTGRRKSDRAATDAAVATVRVAVDKIDQVATQVAQLARSSAALKAVASEAQRNGTTPLATLWRNFEGDITALTESVSGMRNVQVGSVFQRFPRLVRDLAHQLNKNVELEIVGEQIELARELVERIAEPLTHLVRNSIDHGIEAPNQRLAQGKQAKGRLTLSARETSGQVILEVRDDGSGLNREKILIRAAQQGLTVRSGMSDAAVWLLIFEPGFSTADTLSEVSGRGIGMDVAKTIIEALGGHIEIQSRWGVGTSFLLYLPVTGASLSPAGLAQAAA